MSFCGRRPSARVANCRPRVRVLSWIAPVAALTATLAAAAPASADPITYQLVVVATTGPLTGVGSTGKVTFDSSIVPAGGGQVVGPSLFTDVSFVWDRVSYDAGTTHTSALQFDTGGMLTGWDFGTACIANGGGCLVRLVQPGFEDWVVKNDATHPRFFEYGRPDLSFGFGTATLTATPAATPEPTVSALLLSGLAGFCIRRRWLTRV
jgi:hypothetical protein